MKKLLLLFVLLYFTTFYAQKKVFFLRTLKNYQQQIMRFITLFMKRVQKEHYEQSTTSRWIPVKIDVKEARVKLGIPIIVM